MNKTFISTLISVLLLSFAGMAQAGERHDGRGYQSHGRHVSVSHYRGPSRSQYRGRQFAVQRGYAPHHYRHHSSHHDVRNGLKVVAGALVLGSIVRAVNNSHRERVIYRTRTPVGDQDQYWYRVDSDGQCVEVRLNSLGQEVWTYTDPYHCS